VLNLFANRLGSPAGSSFGFCQEAGNCRVVGERLKIEHSRSTQLCIRNGSSCPKAPSAVGQGDQAPASSDYEGGFEEPFRNKWLGINRLRRKVVISAVECHGKTESRDKKSRPLAGKFQLERSPTGQ
jgi:hypothetical protein